MKNAKCEKMKVGERFTYVGCDYVVERESYYGEFKIPQTRNLINKGYFIDARRFIKSKGVFAKSVTRLKVAE